MAGVVEDNKWVVESREWYLAAYSPEGVPTSDHLKLRTVTLSLASDSIPEGHVALETLFLSVDPYLRTMLTGTLDGLFIQQYQLNQVITAFAVGRVIRSKDSKYTEGDLVLVPSAPVAEYCTVPASQIPRKIDAASGISLPDYLSSLGVPGFAAWVGIEVLGDPKPGSNVFISAASGAVGMSAGQLAKIRGCRVIGSTGSDEKVKLIKEEFGYDDGFNYNKESDFNAALSKYFPDGIDVYFDNVGGKMLEAVLNHVNKYARIPLCGMISQYNKVWTEREGVRNLLNMVGKEVRMEGFMLASYWHRFGDFAKDMEGYIKEGKVKSKNKINIGIESFLDSLGSLFSSSNIGKVVVQVKP
ncbi:2-alkenal reductase (NADP(+)-dependent)-like [Gastrolobium bilobum]|uniref:2-alkenal reductase (NADP(+)-dependent)-like n=1 Tax=Gastrolobium bilobum TaxID=150636 RepID=UPI002AB27FF5|nr:2-alkenal reductase (NADP(+)-dependent)-like [Gastrolobium bilobum]